MAPRPPLATELCLYLEGLAQAQGLGLRWRLLGCLGVCGGDGLGVCGRVGREGGGEDLSVTPTVGPVRQGSWGPERRWRERPPDPQSVITISLWTSVHMGLRVQPRSQVSSLRVGSPSLDICAQLSDSSSHDFSGPRAAELTAGDRGGWGRPTRGDSLGFLQDRPGDLGTGAEGLKRREGQATVRGSLMAELDVFFRGLRDCGEVNRGSGWTVAHVAVWDTGDRIWRHPGQTGAGFWGGASPGLVAARKDTPTQEALDREGWAGVQGDS